MQSVPVLLAPSIDNWWSVCFQMWPLVALLVSALVPPSLGDTPANCSFEDIQGNWNFYEGLPVGDDTISCPLTVSGRPTVRLESSITESRNYLPICSV